MYINLILKDKLFENHLELLPAMLICSRLSVFEFLRDANCSERFFSDVQLFNLLQSATTLFGHDIITFATLYGER